MNEKSANRVMRFVFGGSSSNQIIATVIVLALAAVLFYGLNAAAQSDRSVDQAEQYLKQCDWFPGDPAPPAECRQPVAP
jgi:hypothetical protein